MRKSNIISTYVAHAPGIPPNRLADKQARGKLQVNVAIMRAFVQLRKMVTNYFELLRKIEAMEKKYDKKNPDEFAGAFYYNEDFTSSGRL
ncbi:hypothetical protein HQ585_03175 [candidate division KSB1 bacterium]|nr:hypothetical protein [candidate division KSB1 bacterium]